MESEPLLLASLVLDAVTANIKKCDWSGIVIHSIIAKPEITKNIHLQMGLCLFFN